MFPIEDSSGRIIAFSGRILEDDGKSAKYINSPDTSVFDKSSTLFGLSKAKTDIRRLNYSILVEGQMDLIMSHQAEIRNTVASSGTALTSLEIGKEGAINNLGLIKRLSNNIVIAFDSDSAGRKAALRASIIALELGMDVKIADIVGGKDPADIILQNPDDWKNILKHTKSVIEFELDNVLKESEANKRTLPRLIVGRVLPLVASLQNNSEKSFYSKMISDKSGISEQALLDDLNNIKKQRDSETNSLQTKGTSSISNKNNNNYNRFNEIERKIVGLLFLLKKNAYSKVDELISRSFKVLNKEVDLDSSIVKEYSFEADISFGASDEERARILNELLIAFEIENINNTLLQLMNDIKIHEKDKNVEKVQELAKECQSLSIRKAQLVKMMRENRF
jgi:DNA primase